MSAPTRRMAIALLALAGFFVSLYLLLYKLGVYGSLVCGAGGACDRVQMSEHASFLGLPVAGWGTAWYVAVFGAALLGVQPRFREARWPGPALRGLAAVGLAFSAYLTYVELFVIGAICRYCVASALIVLAIFALTLPLGTGRTAARTAQGSGSPSDPETDA